MKNTLRIFAALFAVAALVLAAQSASAVSVKEVIGKSQEAYKKVESVKYVYYTHGYDTFARKTAEAATAKEGQGKVDSKASDGKSQLVDATYNVKFMKPYVLQMVIVEGDLMPDLVLDGKFTYNGATKPKDWWAKLKNMPAMKKSVTKDDSYGLLTMGWSMNILHLLNYATNGTPKLVGKDKFMGKECYVLEVSFTADDWKKFKVVNINLKGWGFPEQMKQLVFDSLSGGTEKKYSSVKFWIGTDDFFIYKIEDYIKGKFFWRTEFRNVQVNALKKSDFSPK